MSHSLVNLAREAIRYYLATGDYLEVNHLPGDGPPQALFVSLHDRAEPGQEEGRLRGCRGSIHPTGPTLFAELVRQAVNAAVDDPRCESIWPDEADEIDITVYLLGPLETVDRVDQLDPARYGVLVEGMGGRRALLLPGIPGIESGAQQVQLTRRKAFIGPDERVTLRRFEAEVLK